ncbi:MAG: SAM-dependent methyltransferase [Alphaproteobacteria bacterium]|nr:SAM-dependent methyltransferase [Alphaproteobacteria bacterium]
MDTVESVIKAHIRTHGPMTIETFMGLALGHPQHGYYMTRDPLGVAGDFTTAPEISQLFGEMVGICLADAWLRAGAPPFHLVELGPGRGTLMADILRATKNVPAFHARMHLHLVETSPVLRAKQDEALKDYRPTWHASGDTLPDDAPLLVVANEFFDALPIRQLMLTENGLVEQVVGLEGEKLTMGLAPAPSTLLPRRVKNNEIIEISPIRETVMEGLAIRIGTQGGMLLAIDYGHDTPEPAGDTFQAVYKHRFCDPLEHVGDADLTSHVDFHALKAIAKRHGCEAYGSISQKEFLEAMGIHARYAQLNDTKLESGLMRLLDPNDMGNLFKVIAVTSSGFSPAAPSNRA